jgi:lipoprotein-releasing system permease protein
MNTELFIAKRLIAKSKSRFSRPIIRIASLAISLSLAVMIIATAVVTGFQQEIRDKVIGFGSHIQVTHLSDDDSYDSKKLSDVHSIKESIASIDGIAHFQVFANKAGIIKTKEEIQGVVLKGVGSDFKADFFEKHLVQGSVPTYNDSITSKSVLISKSMAEQLKLGLDDKLHMYFVQQPPRVRQFKVGGIYETGLAELDELMVLADIKHIQKLNDWNSNEVGGLEVSIENFDDLEVLTEEVYRTIGFDLNAQDIMSLHPQLFDWLALQDINVQVIIILMVLVAAINMITALLILILERTKLIGLLKALGANNWSIRKIFLYNGAHLILKGMLWGNLVGIGLAIVQQQFQWVQLDPETYYMSFVPIQLSLLHLFLLNVGTLICCWSMLIFPSYMISKITPVKSIRFQ